MVIVEWSAGLSTKRSHHEKLPSREAQPNLTMAHVDAKKAMDCNEIRGLARCGHSIAKKSTNDFACFNFTFFQ